MILIQQNINLSKEGMYVAAITSLVACIVWLALYIRKLHNKTVQIVQEHKTESLVRSKENKEMLIGLVRQTTEVIANVNNTIENNTETIQRSAEQKERSDERTQQAINNLNQTILTQIKRSE